MNPKPLASELHLHWIALVPFLLTITAAFPFEEEPLWYVGVGFLVFIALTLRLHTPRLGLWPARVLTLLVGGAILARAMDAADGRVPARSVLAQVIGLVGVGVILLPAERGRTFLACLLAVMTLVTAGMVRNDMVYAVSLAGFFLTVPYLFAFGHLHEAVRVRHFVLDRNAPASLAGKAVHLLATGARTSVTLLFAFALYLILPKPAVMPISASQFSGPSNTLVEGLDVGRVSVPRGTRPFLRVESPYPVYLVGQMFNRYVRGRWMRVTGPDKYRLNRQGRFPLPPSVDGCRRGASVTDARADISLAGELPDLLLLPEGARELRINSWHTMGVPPFHLRSWGGSGTTTYAVFYDPPAALDSLAPDHTTTGAVPDPVEREVPRGVDPGVARLARTLTAGAPTPQAKLSALLAHLATCTYDTHSTVPVDVDPVRHFLLESHTGYCVHFASALAVLCRLSGLPSRMVTGYAPGDLGAASPGKRAVALVRPRDAHAWVHVWIERHGWVSADATKELRHISLADQTEDWLADDPLTPSGGLKWETGGFRSVDTGLKGAKEFISNHMVAFTVLALLVLLSLARQARWTSAQLEAERAAAGSSAAPPSGGGLRTPAFPASPDAPRSGQDAVPTRPPGAFLTPGGSASGADLRHALSARFDALCERLAASGHAARFPSQTPMEYARALPAPLGEAVERVARALYAVLLSRHTDPAQLEELEREFEQLERQLDPPV